MAMSWSIGAQEDHTWRQEEDTEKKGREQERKREKEGERQKNKVRNTENTSLEGYQRLNWGSKKRKSKLEDQSKKKSQHVSSTANDTWFMAGMGGGSQT